MRVAGLCVLVSTGCAQVLGLDTPALSGAGSDAGPTDATGDAAHLGDAPKARCEGDTFDDNMIDVSRWFVFQEATTSVTETNKQLALFIDDATANAYCGVDAVNPIAAAATGVQLEIIQPSPNTATELALVLSVNADNQLVFGKDEAYLTATVRTNGVNANHSIQWSTPQHRFLRIERGADTLVTFSTSLDGTSWTKVWQQDATFAQQTLTPEIYAGHYMQVSSATAIVDNFVILNPACDP